MWDDIDYDFTALELPNLGWAKSKTDPPNVPVSLCATLAPLAHAAAKKFPNWKFVGCGAFRGVSNRMYIDALNVYEGRERLGTLGFVMHPAIKFVIDNKRIKKTRKLSGGAKTGDVKKALKLMTEYFCAQTSGEKSLEASEKLSKAMSSSQHSIAQGYSMALDICLKALGAYVHENFEAVSAAAIAAGAPAGAVNNIPSLKEDLDTVNTIYDASSKKRGRFVTLDGSDYITRQRTHPHDDPNLKTYSSDTLPAAIKLKIGLLKLIEDNHYMKDVGYRLDAANFYVLVDPD